MKNYEKKAFVQIFLGYFISVSIFIILLGFLYYNQQKVFVMQKTAMNMHQYITEVKHSGFLYKKDGYSYTMVKRAKIIKQLPQRDHDVYFKAFSHKFIVKIDTSIVDKELDKIRLFTISLQIILILFFAIISWLLTKKSLKPMSDTISHLDRFTKDLVHDLNTPVTSIMLNTRLLKKNANEKELKQISRIENSATSISALYANLEILLDEHNLIKENFNIKSLTDEIIEIYKISYPNIDFNLEFKEEVLYSNKEAVRRIVDNIISNACKYSIDRNPNINIIYQNDILSIKDNGKGIKYPKKIFERTYRENNLGHGIGMHIVYRLCDELSIDINIFSKPNNGTKIVLEF